MADAPNNANYLLTSSDTDLPFSRVLFSDPFVSNYQLNDSGPGGNLSLVPVLKVGSLISLSSAGLVAFNGNETFTPRTLTSITTLDITNGNGLGGNPILEVLDDTSKQKISVTINGGGVRGTRANLNFISGNNTTISASDNSGNNAIDVTVSAATGIPIDGSVAYLASATGHAFNLGTLTTGILKVSVASSIATPSIAIGNTDYMIPTPALIQLGNLNPTSGQTIVTSGNTFNLLAPGSNGQVLTMTSGTTIGWANATSSANAFYLVQNATNLPTNGINLGATNAQLGIGITSPAHPLDIVSAVLTPINIVNTSNTTEYLITNYSGGPSTQVIDNTIFLQTARGTPGAPVALSTNDIVGGFRFLGYDGSQFISGATILAVATATLTPANHSTSLQFATSNGVTRALAFTLNPDQSATFAGAVGMPAGGSLGGTFSGNATLSGVLTFTGNNVFSNASGSQMVTVGDGTHNTTLVINANSTLTLVSGSTFNNNASVNYTGPQTFKGNVTFAPTASTTQTIALTSTTGNGINITSTSSGGAPIAINLDANTAITTAGVNTFNGSTSLNGGGTLAGTFVGTPTFSGGMTFGGASTVTFNNGFAVSSNSTATINNLSTLSLVSGSTLSVAGTAGFTGTTNIGSGAIFNFLSGSTTNFASGSTLNLNSTVNFSSGFTVPSGQTGTFASGSTATFLSGSSVLFADTPGFGNGAAVAAGTFNFLSGTALTMPSGTTATLAGSINFNAQLNGTITAGYAVIQTCNNPGGGGGAQYFSYTSTNPQGPVLALAQSRGAGTTLASPTQSSDILGTVIFRGQTTSSFPGTFVDSSYIISSATQNWSTAPAHGSNLAFYTSPNSSASGPLVALTLNPDQTATFAGKITIPGFTSSGPAIINNAIVQNTINTNFILALADNHAGGGGGVIQYLTYSGTGIIGPRLQLQQTRGTPTVPVPTTSGDQLGTIEFWGNTNNGLVIETIGAQIVGVATQTWAPSSPGPRSAGSRLDFYTTANNTINNILAVSINQDQTTTFAQPITVNGGPSVTSTFNTLFSFGQGFSVGGGNVNIATGGTITIGGGGTVSITAPTGSLIQYNSGATFLSGADNRFTSNVAMGANTTATHTLQLFTDDAAKTTTATWTITSDGRIKTDIVDTEEALPIINALKTRKYRYTDEWKTEHQTFDEDNNPLPNPYGDEAYYGFIADEVMEVIPSCVTVTDITIGSVSNLKTLNTHNMNVLLFKAVQELSAQLDGLKAEINALKGA